MNSYIGIDLHTEEVTVIASRPEYVRDGYMLKGEHSPDLNGVIYVDSDGTHNGDRALEILLAQDEPIGLGWTFKPRYSAAWSA